MSHSIPRPWQRCFTQRFFLSKLCFCLSPPLRIRHASLRPGPEDDLTEIRHQAAVTFPSDDSGDVPESGYVPSLRKRYLPNSSGFLEFKTLLACLSCQNSKCALMCLNPKTNSTGPGGTAPTLILFLPRADISNQLQFSVYPEKPLGFFPDTAF